MPRHSFATSTFWMGDVLDTAKDGSYTVDLSGFLTRDDLNIAAGDQERGRGEFRFVPELSVADPNFVKVFPSNIELAAKLTSVREPKAEVSNIVAGNS